MHKKKYLYREENGFAAIIVTLVIMTIIVLVVIGFFAVVNREQRASIDRQLSTQAFYAAETGVNDAASALVADDIDDIDDCSGFQGSAIYDDRHLSQDEEIEYTCVIVDSSPDSLAYDSVKTERATVVIIKAVDDSGSPVDLSRLNVSWQSEELPNSISFPSSGDDFPADWPYAAPVLRTSLTPINLNNINRQELIEQTATTFLRPRTSGSSSYGLTFGQQHNQGDIVPARCNENDEPKYCNISFGIPSGSGSEFLLTLRGVYHSANVFITGESGGGNGVQFADQQAVIDSTGRAGDVLRRMQVRVPLRQQFNRPGFALEATGDGGVCKKYSVHPGQGQNGGGSVCTP